jgi:hypothetical protein
LLSNFAAPSPLFQCANPKPSAEAFSRQASPPASPTFRRDLPHDAFSRTFPSKVKTNDLKFAGLNATALLNSGKCLTGEQAYSVFKADSDSYYGDIKEHLGPALGLNAGRKMDKIADRLRKKPLKARGNMGEPIKFPWTDNETKQKVSLEYLGYGQFSRTYKLMWENKIYVLKVFREVPYDIEKTDRWKKKKYSARKKACLIRWHRSTRLPEREVAQGAFMTQKGFRATKLYAANPFRGWTLMEFEDRNKINVGSPEGFTPAQLGCIMRDVYAKNGLPLKRNTINGKIVDHGGEMIVPECDRYTDEVLAAKLEKWLVNGNSSPKTVAGSEVPNNIEDDLPFNFNAPLPLK